METFSEQLSSSYKNLVEKLTSWLNLIVLQIPNIVIAATVMVLAYIFAKYVRKFARKTASKFTTNGTVLNLVSNLSTVMFGVMTMFLVLTVMDLGGTINKILATAGVLGLAVGLALQDPMTNLFSGVMMSVRELYEIGDLVETNGFFGHISDIDLRSTKVKLPTGQIVVIPNKEVIQKPLTNFTISGKRRVDIACGVSYGDDLDKVEQVVRDTIQSLPSVLQSETVDVIFKEFGDSSINFVARFWIDSVGLRDFLVEQSNAIKAIKKAFDANDIMIPFPITTLDFGIKGGVPLEKMLTIKHSSSDANNSHR